MTNPATHIWQIIREAARDWIDDKASVQGAALAFYSILSLAPLVVISLAVIGLFFDRNAATSRLLSQVQLLVGQEGAQAIGSMLPASNQPATSTLAAVLGMATLLLGASGVFGQLQDTMNMIWDVEPRPGAGIVDFMRRRFLSFAMVLGTSFLLLVSLLLSTVIGALGQALSASRPELEVFIHLGNELVTFIVVTLLFAMIFKLLPDKQVAWRDVWMGAFLTALLFVVGKLLIGLYLGKSAIGSAYGAAGSLVVLVVWIYYSAQILFLGAEIAHTQAEYRQHRSAHPAVPFQDRQPPRS